MSGKKSDDKPELPEVTPSTRELVHAIAVANRHPDPEEWVARVLAALKIAGEKPNA